MNHKPHYSEHRYNKDFYAWSLYNAELIREGKLSEVDLQNVAEEIESMGRSARHKLINRFAILLAHLLKWKFQPERRGKSWKFTIREQRIRIQKLLKESPSLKYELQEQFNDAYEIALLVAEKETDLTEGVFPNVCPFSSEETLNKDFFPD